MRMITPEITIKGNSVGRILRNQSKRASLAYPIQAAGSVRIHIARNIKNRKEKKRFISESCKVCYAITYAHFVKDMQQSFL